jgi:hypothetical protein
MGDGRFQNRSYPIKVKFFFDFDGFDFYRVPGNYDFDYTTGELHSSIFSTVLILTS